MKQIPEWVIRQSLDHRLDQWAVEPAAFRYMIEKGFPYGASYQQARQAFDGMRYAGPRGTRYYSVVNDLNYTLVTAPTIGFGPPPEIWADQVVLAAHRQVDALRALVDAHAEEEWPGKYFFRPGDWQIFTTHKKMVREAKKIGMVLLSSRPRHAHVLSGICLDAAKQAAVVRLIEKYQHGHLVRDYEAAARQAQALLLESLDQAIGQEAGSRDAWL
jgi:hypothetical protein